MNFSTVESSGIAESAFATGFSPYIPFLPSPHRIFSPFLILSPYFFFPSPFLPRNSQSSEPIIIPRSISLVIFNFCIPPVFITHPRVSFHHSLRFNDLLVDRSKIFHRNGG